MHQTTTSRPQPVPPNNPLCRLWLGSLPATRSLLITTMISLLLLSCTLASRLTDRFSALDPTVTAVATSTKKQTQTTTATWTVTTTPTHPPTASNTSPPTKTPSPSITPSVTLRQATGTYTGTPTRTPIPPSFTPGPGQITAGQNAWTLISVDIVHKITVWEVTFPASIYPGDLSGYKFLRLNFECTTGKTLISLLTGEEQGLTFVHNPQGYANIYVKDSQGRSYPVVLYGDCWLAAPVLPGDRYTLYFLDLNPLPIIAP